MVVRPGPRPLPVGRDYRRALRELLRRAREFPFEAGDRHQWHRAVSSFAARIHATLERDGAPYALKEASSALVRDLLAMEEPSFLDVARVSDHLFEMEDEVTRGFQVARPRGRVHRYVVQRGQWPRKLQTTMCRV